MLGIMPGVESVLQRKFIVPDVQNIIPRDMPLTIFADKQHLQWSDEERELIRSDPEYNWPVPILPGIVSIIDHNSGFCHKRNNVCEGNSPNCFL